MVKRQLFIIASAISLFLVTAANSQAATVTGTISGYIGSPATPLQADLFGTLYQNTHSGFETLSFAPDAYPAELVGNNALDIIVTVYKCTVTCAMAAATNENYSISRQWSFNGNPTPQLFVNASVSSSDPNSIFVDENVWGDFPVSGAITSYSAYLTPGPQSQNGQQSAIETINVAFSSGDSATGTGIYQWTGPSLASPSSVKVSWPIVAFSDHRLFDTYSIAGACPEPATWATMLLGFWTIGLMMRSRRKNVAAASAATANA